MTLAWGVLHGSIAQQVAEALLFTAATLGNLALAIWAYREWRNSNRPALAVILIGAAVNTLGDAGARLLVGLRADPASNSPLFYRAFDIDIAIWMAPAFPIYAGVGGYLTYLALRNRWAVRKFWFTVGALVLADIAGELAMIHLGQLYGYVGNQSLKLLGLPLVWPAGYVLTGVLTGALVFFLGQRLTGARQLLLLPITSSAYFGILTVVSWPAIVVVHTDLPPIATSLVGLATLAGMATVTYVLTTFLRPAAAPATADTDRLPTHVG
jgi:hypothetical protein